MMVSVVVATYKREEPLVNALESLANQNFFDFEIVLVDDNDNDKMNKKVSEIRHRPFRAFSLSMP